MDKLIRVTISVFFALLSGCSEDGIIGTGEKPMNGPLIQGAVQKGPFVRGSKVSFINYLTGTVTETVTKNSLGSFEFNPEPGAFYIVSGNGHYFNEITVSVSAHPINLYAYYLVDDGSNAFLGVNLLTHLVFRRIESSLNNGIKPKDAIAEAQGQLLSAINDLLPNGVTITNNFTGMSIYNVENTNAIENTFLLFFSAMTYQAALTAATNNSEIVDLELINLLYSLTTDLSFEGRFSETNKITLIQASRKLNPDKIARNLQQKSMDVLGEKLPVPDINIFLDTDGDGVANSADPDDDGDGIADGEDRNPYLFEIIPNEQQEILTQRDVAVELNLEFNLPPGHMINIGIARTPAHGKIAGVYPELVYTPELDYRGLDHFDYYVQSGAYKSAVVVVTLEVL